MSLDNKIQHDVQLGGPTITQAGFGTVLVLGAATFAERIKFFGPDDDYETDSELSSALQDALSIAFQQEPKPQRVAIGRRDSDAAQSIEFTVDSVAAGDYTISIDGTDYTHTAAGGDTVAQVAAALQALVDADADVTATEDGVDTVTVTADTVGEGFGYESSAPDGASITEVEAQANVSVATELAAVAAADGDWFGICLETRDETDILRAGKWANANGRLFMGQMADADAGTSLDTDIASQLTTLGYKLAAFSYYSDDSVRFDVGYLAGFLAHSFDETAPTACYNTVVGVPADVDDTTFQKNLEDKNANYYSTLKGSPSTFPGVTASGHDIEHVVTGEWTKARIDELIAQRFKEYADGGRRIQFNDLGFGVIEQAAYDVLQNAEGLGHYNDGTSEVDMPLRANVSDADVGNGLLRWKWGSQYSGTVKETNITGHATLDFSGF